MAKFNFDLVDWNVNDDSMETVQLTLLREENSLDQLTQFVLL